MRVYRNKRAEDMILELKGGTFMQNVKKVIKKSVEPPLYFLQISSSMENSK